MTFTDVGSELELAPGSMRRVVVEGANVVLVCTDAGLFALEDHCPHAGAPLSEGTLSEGRITCSWHGWRFDCATGACDLFAGAPGAVRRAVRIEAGRVMVGSA